MSTYPMDPVDAAWYHIDGPANLAMVTGVALTRQPLDFDKVREVYRHRLAGFDRFRQRVVETGLPIATPHWEDMPHFDIDQHLHRIALPAPHDIAALKALFTDIASMPLDREQPLWQVHVVEDVAGGSAIIIRYHHCIGDGTAFQAVVRKLFDTRPDAPLEGAPEKIAPAKLEAPSGALASGFETLERAARRAVALAGSAVDVVAHPQQLLEQAGLVIGGAGVLLTELVKPADPPSPFKGDFGIRKHVAWSTPVAIQDIKAIGAPSGAKVNDVLVAAMTGALRAYLVRRGVDVNHTTVRAMVPVDLRPPERVGQLGNEFGLVLLDLPVVSRKATDRLAETKARMDRLKRSPEPVAMKFLFDLFGRGPKAIEDVATSIFGSKASLVMTNVVGPKDPVYLAGVPIEQMMFWVPHPGKELGMGISILSYRGKASLAVIADAGLVPDPEAITDEFNREFERMRRAALPRRKMVRPQPGAAARKAGSARARRASER
ncbi:MAG: wax ester/triacylglycerol synthase family O-acyltransferase [Burkholderiales bacterium]|nr:MAG: wax ester/triacylglycerol synthase family O-acyltransferase [Burkholderiales bacterium]